MYGQLYLFPELAPLEKPAKKRGSKKAQVQPVLPAPLTINDFINTPGGGFREREKPLEVQRDGCEAPLEYMNPFIRQFAPTHTKAIAEYKKRLERLSYLLVEEYVRLHAAAEKKHPEWFKDGESIDPDKFTFVPFTYCYFNSDDKGVLDSNQWYSDFEQGIPLSVCADLVKSLNLHYPTYGYSASRGSEHMVADLTAGSRIRYEINPKGKAFLILFAGDIEQVIKNQIYVGYHLSEAIPDELPEPFGTLSRIYARASMFLTGKTKPCTMTSDSFIFRLYAVDDEERRKEQQELQTAIETGLSSWNGFYSTTTDALIVQAKKNLENDESHLMELIHSGEKKECI